MRRTKSPRRKKIASNSVGARLERSDRATSGPPAAHEIKARKMTKVSNPINMGDKLYLITRRDISPGYQGVQACHAMRQFTADHPERDIEWFKNSNYLAFLSVQNEVELMRLLVAASDHGVRASAFREPDAGGAITAIALEPHPKTIELCKNLQLALRDVK